MSLKKRVLSVITAAGIMFTAVPVSVLSPCIAYVSAAAENETIKENLTLDADMAVSGDLTMTGGKLCLNGHKLTVGGNFYQPGGVLDVGTGSVKVGGNYEVQNAGGGYGNGEFQLYKENSLIDVDGDVIINSSVKKSDYQYDGTLKIGGSLKVSSPYSGRGYMPSGSHVTMFKGDEIHEVCFYDSTNNNLNIVSSTDSGQLYITGGTSGFTLASDMTFAGGSEIRGSRELELNGNTLTVDGDFTQNGSLTVDVGDGLMQVSGNYYQPLGILDVSNGTVKVGGNYEVQSAGGGYGNGEFQLYKENSLIDVDGDVIINSSVEKSEYQYDGTLKIGGSLKVSSPYSGRGYMPSGSHVTVFKGDKIHEVNFSDSTNNNLNIVSSTDSGQLYITGGTSGFILDSDVIFADGSEIKGSRELELRGNTLTVDGDFTQSGSLTVDVGDGLMQVSGNYYQSGGVLDVGTGSVKVGGNYELQNEGGGYGNGEFQLYKENSLIDVDGDVIINSSVEKSEYQYDGTLKIGGSLKVSSPYSGRGYMPSGSHVTMFKGDEIHEVCFYDSTNNNLNIVSSTDSGQLYITGGTSGFTLASDMTFAGGSEIRGSRELELNGNTLTVDGDFTQNGSLTVDVGDGLMQISGNYYQPLGILDVSSGTVKVGGNYEVQNAGGGYGNGEIWIYKENSFIDVDGDVIINSSVKKSEYQYDGTFVIGGSLTVSSPYSGRGYMPSGSHVTEFKGGKAHKVYFTDTGNYTNNIRLGIGDSVEFTGALNGVSGGVSGEITVDSAIASVDGMSVKGVSKGVCGIVFRNGENSVKKALEVSETNTGIYTPDIKKPEKFYSLELDDNAMLLYGIGSGKVFSRGSLGGLVIGTSETEEVGGITFSGCNELTYAIIQGGVKKVTDLGFKNCRSLMKLVVVNSECDLSGLTLSGFNGTVYGNTGSTAEAYAKEHGLRFSNTGSDIDDGKTYSGEVTISLGEAVSAGQGGTVYLPVYMDTAGAPVYGSNICVNPGGEYLVSDDYLDPADCGFECGLTVRDDGGYDVDPEKPVRIYKMVIGSSADIGKYTAAVKSIWSGDTEPEVFAKIGDAEGNLPVFFKPSVKSCDITVEKAAVTTAPITTAPVTSAPPAGTTVSAGSVVTGTDNVTTTAYVTGTSAAADTGTGAGTASTVLTVSEANTGAVTTSVSVETYVYEDFIYYVTTGAGNGGNNGGVIVSLYDVSFGEELEIPHDIKDIPVIGIGDKAFEKGTYTSVKIPEGVESIGNKAFADSGLESVNIPGSIKNIGDSPFFNCGKLETISVSEGNENYRSDDGVLLTKDGSVLVQYPNGSKNTEYSVPDSIKTIGDGAFFGNSYIEEVKIPEGVEKIGEQAFGKCEYIKNADIPESVISIGDKAFMSCGSLESITIRNPECQILGDGSSISGSEGKFGGTIYAPQGSAAQEYAEKYGYKFEAIGGTFLRGDISGNGKVDLYDAIEIAKSMMGVRVFTDAEKEIADFNADGRVNLYDAIDIAKYLITGILPGLG